MYFTIAGMNLYVDFVQVGILALALLIVMLIGYVVGRIHGYDAGIYEANEEWRKYMNRYDATIND